MKIETKFSCGDKVFTIKSETPRVLVPCGFCEGGRIEGKDGSTRLCPECWGNLKYERGAIQWNVEPQEKTIGQIRFEYTKSMGLTGDEVLSPYTREDGVEEKYMLAETGIGSGVLWDLCRIHATKRKAKQECERLNKLEEKK